MSTFNSTGIWCQAPPILVSCMRNIPAQLQTCPNIWRWTARTKSIVKTFRIDAVRSHIMASLIFACSNSLSWLCVDIDLMRIPRSWSASMGVCPGWRYSVNPTKCGAFVRAIHWLGDPTLGPCTLPKFLVAPASLFGWNDLEFQPLCAGLGNLSCAEACLFLASSSTRAPYPRPQPPWLRSLTKYSRFAHSARTSPRH
jgi:hypothetical protein